MNEHDLTPMDISKKISSKDNKAPSYNWDKQTRFETLSAGFYTHNSKQTFDNFGNAVDSRGDNDD
jgi:hypothetical protein